jgi:uncharacterized protein
MENILQILARELGAKEKNIENVISLIDEGNTIPFIARYRKELHGSMDDTMLRALNDRLNYLRNLQSRREEVIKAIDSQGKLTGELQNAIESASTLSEVEDIYRPYKQKRRTRATIAREKGLEPLAALLFSQKKDLGDINGLASKYVDSEKGVETVQEALSGASDIIAEDISDAAPIRKRLRELTMNKGGLVSAAAKDEDSVYRLYYDFNIPASRLQGHQILALNRGEREGFLKVNISADRAGSLDIVWGETLKPGSPSTDFVKAAGEDSFDRLIFPSLEREIRSSLTDSASEGAIKMFALNLKPLLMQPPVRGKVTLGLDPAYRTGCKIAVVDATGKVLDTSVVYPTPPHNKKEEAKAALTRLIDKHGVKNLAIGNGTASRESERFVSELLGELGRDIGYAIVNEAGASVYSASELGAEEFPDFDVSLRSAVSIARRLQDPLAELVKIDPKAIGVGQYQHDMPQKRLDETLIGVVEDCVNSVGVDLNTASPSLLSRVSGLSQATAKNIVRFRDENGAFRSRAQLKKVPKLGPKAYEQCAGFLRIPGGEFVLDNTSVHPESYDAAKKLLDSCGYSLGDAVNGNLAELPTRIRETGEEKISKLCNIGIPTLRDIASELQKPGRDPRDELMPPILRTDVMEIGDLKPGMVLKGTVRNVIDFGAFVDIGVHQDGLVHISQICDRFIRHPSEVLSVGDIVDVAVLEVDENKKRISLSIKQAKRV